MDNITLITADDLIKNKNTRPPPDMKDPKDITLFYETAISREEGSNPNILLKIYQNYFEWATKQGENSPVTLHQILKNFTHKMRKEESLYQNSQYVLLWVKYALEVQEMFDVYNYMAVHKIGTESFIYHLNYALSVEKHLRDFKKVDKMFRISIKKAPSRKKSKIQYNYSLFAERMKERYNLITKSQRKSTISSSSPSSFCQEHRREAFLSKRNRDLEGITPIKQRMMPHPSKHLKPGEESSRAKQPSFTQSQYNVDKSCLIYVDRNQREEFISKASIYVDKYYTELEIQGESLGIISESKVHISREKRPQSWVSMIGSFTCAYNRNNRTASQESIDCDEIPEKLIFTGECQDEDSKVELISPEEKKANRLRFPTKRKSNNKLKSILKAQKSSSSENEDDSIDKDTVNSHHYISGESVIDSLQKTREKYKPRKQNNLNQEEENFLITENSKKISQKPFKSMKKANRGRILRNKSQKEWLDRNTENFNKKSTHESPHLKLCDFKKYQPELKEGQRRALFAKSSTKRNQSERSPVREIKPKSPASYKLGSISFQLRDLEESDSDQEQL
ncbi:unnamed protein product [Moneuplotes crassus]|uniref:BUB1 N-terminal domain-containing protein n=1 Tax=Euplotes crassus TaxID=5936 RepID=A0AAD1U6N3_EUPCR|nr:unnamed protein product [Moneuplotes crassus]